MFKSSHQNGFSLVLLPGVVFRVLLFSKTLFCKVIFITSSLDLCDWTLYIKQKEKKREKAEKDNLTISTTAWEQNFKKGV